MTDQDEDVTESQPSGNATTLPTEFRFTSKCVIVLSLSPVSVLCSDYCPYSYMWVAVLQICRKLCAGLILPMFSSFYTMSWLGRYCRITLHAVATACVLNIIPSPLLIIIVD